MHNPGAGGPRASPPSAGNRRLPRSLGASHDPSDLHETDGTRDLGSLRELNQRFLGLEWTRSAFDGCIAGLTIPQRTAAADCPYALFDLRLGDGDYWQQRLRQPEARQVADADAIGAELAEFTRLALFYAWHAAAAAGYPARVALCMHERTAAALRGITVNRIPDLVITESRSVSARWGHCAQFWTALARAAASGDPQRLRRVQLSGIQLAAATQLPLRREPRAV